MLREFVVLLQQIKYNYGFQFHQLKLFLYSFWGIFPTLIPIILLNILTKNNLLLSYKMIQSKYELNFKASAQVGVDTRSLGLLVIISRQICRLFFVCRFLQGEE